MFSTFNMFRKLNFLKSIKQFTVNYGARKSKPKCSCLCPFKHSTLLYNLSLELIENSYLHAFHHACTVNMQIATYQSKVAGRGGGGGGDGSNNFKYTKPKMSAFRKKIEL
jgi:hypothetical protein